MTVGEKARLAGEILAAYVGVRRTMLRRQLPQVLVRLRSGSRSNGRRPPVSPDDPWPVAMAIPKVLGPLPADSRCLVRSLVLLTLLERRGISTRLVIGARMAPEFAAHAWIERDGEALLPTGGGEFQRLVEL
jgi:hypothetical protein